MKLKITLAGLVLLLATAPASATVCSPENGVVKDIPYDLSDKFSAANNQIGERVEIKRSGYANVNAVCPEGTTGFFTKRSYVTQLPVIEIEGNFKYLKINDYLIAAMSIVDDAAGIFYPPTNYAQMGGHVNVPYQRPFGVADSNFVFRLKVTRRFVNMVPIPKQTMFTVYVTTEAGEPLNIPVYTISYSGRIEVPQTCELNVGQIVEFDFGNINAARFSQAGRGNIPQGVAPQTKTVGIKCTNVEAQALLTLRLEAQKSDGQMMVSGNNDVGFLVSAGAGGNKRTLTPGDVNSKIPFQLDGAATAIAPVEAVPVSVTGKAPVEGRVTAQGYLRVDYD